MVAIVADAVDEPGVETFTVTLSEPRYAELGAATATASILDDDGTINVAADVATVAEGDRARFVVELSGAVASPVALAWATADGTATADADYVAVPDGTLTIQPGHGTATDARGGDAAGRSGRV